MARKTQKVVITAKALRVRKSYSLDSEVLRVIKDPGGIYEISSTRNGFGKLVNEAGWICLNYVEVL